MLIPLFALAMMASPQQAAGHVPVYPEDKQIVLTGRIEFLHGYGPPGWGEDPKHDEHIVYWVILNSPHRWAATDCQSTKRLRLMIDTSDQLTVAAKTLLGRRAKVTGVLHRADTAGEMTPIYIDVSAITPSP